MSLEDIEASYPAYLASTGSSSASSASSSVSPNSSHPLFVTWNTSTSTSTHQLRGCIGTFTPSPLATSLAEYALISAQHDTRFSPITARELAHLSVCVTLLTDFEDCADPLDWTVGQHGIRVGFEADGRGRRFSACYLPDVASEQGWSAEETLVSAMRKAGWRGRRGAETWEEVRGAVEDVKVVRFRGDKRELEWKEFVAWKTWVDGDQR